MVAHLVARVAIIRRPCYPSRYCAPYFSISLPTLSTLHQSYLLMHLSLLKTKVYVSLKTTNVYLYGHLYHEHMSPWCLWRSSLTCFSMIGSPLKCPSPRQKDKKWESVQQDLHEPLRSWSFSSYLLTFMLQMFILISIDSTCVTL